MHEINKYDLNEEKAGTATAQKIFELSPDVLITGNGPGETAAKTLERLSMKIFVNAHNMTLKQAYEACKDGKLAEISRQD
ncbi:MAG: hypothetical protein D4R67_06985 [Bacteroidetes bacterium]|nr:MAG: hypothetical protein D4R67_06985 [Bacteroidota bacterium]